VVYSRNGTAIIISQSTGLLFVTYIVFISTCITDLHLLQPCQHTGAKNDGSEMLCRMPAVILPYDLSEQLNKSDTGTINNTQGPGVAVYMSIDRLARAYQQVDFTGRTRADIYIGFILDGFKRYRNISSVYPNISMQFSLPPYLRCKHADVYFDPSKDTVISIKVINCLTVKRNSLLIWLGNLQCGVVTSWSVGATTKPPKAVYPSFTITACVSSFLFFFAYRSR